MMATFGDRMRIEINKYKNADYNEIIKINESYIKKFIEKCKREMENNVLSGTDRFNINIDYSFCDIQILDGVTGNAVIMIIQQEIVRRLKNEGLNVSIITTPSQLRTIFQISL